MEYGDRLSITTPEGVDLELTLAGIGSRFIAASIDLTIELAIGAVAALGVLLAFDSDGIRILLLSVGGFLLLFGYDVAFEVLAGGRTPGKRWTGLRVVRESGAPVTFVTSSIRNVLRLVDVLPIAYGVGMVTVFFNRRNQRLGDLAAGTIVARERHGGRQKVPTAPPPPAAPILSTAGWDTSAITAQELAAVRSFLERRATLAPGARAHLAQTLGDRLRAKVAGAPPLEHEAFLERLAKHRE
jgi:uncharacterized RDD family membrane protein YckC